MQAKWMSHFLLLGTLLGRSFASSYWVAFARSRELFLPSPTSSAYLKISATTHTDLLLRARQLGVPTRALPNASIMNAIGACGLSLYTYGQTVSMPFFTDNWRPSSFYDKLAENAILGLHTLVLLDIKVKEPNLEAMARGRKVWEPPRYMTVKQCAAQMIEVEEDRKQAWCREQALAVGAARVGSSEQTFCSGTLSELSEIDMGRPLHCLVVIGQRCHELEKDVIREWAVNKSSFDKAWEKGAYGQYEKAETKSKS